MLLCVLLAGCCFWMGLRSESPPGGVNPSVASAVSVSGPQTQAIESVRVGQRVIARNPEVAEAERSAETAVDPATWRKLRLVAENRWEDGTDDPVEVETLQPPEWVTEHGARVGALVPIPLDLVEMGLPEGLRARVLANDPCPPIEPGAGNVVLTTVNHLNRDVWELTLSDDQGHTEQIRPTGLHKFYSQSRGEWVSARDLRPGELLGGLHRPLNVARLERVPGVHRVYNLTVEGEHVYHVSTLVVVAHNEGCGTTRLFRAVGENELNDVLRFGDYDQAPSGGGKYFTFTEADARAFARSSINAGRRMTITSTEVPNEFIEGSVRSGDAYRFFDPGGGGRSIHFSDDILPQLYKIMTLPDIVDAPWVPRIGG